MPRRRAADCVDTDQGEVDKGSFDLLKRQLTLEKIKRKRQMFYAFLSTRHQVIVAESVEMELIASTPLLPCRGKPKSR
jgi:hypothetical protein